MKKNIQSAERVSQTDVSDNYVYQRSLLAYHLAAEAVSGSVLEIGTGSGYGVSLISPRVASFMTIDKFLPRVDFHDYDNVEFHQMVVPPLRGVVSSSVDYVICFQVIEHIKDDYGLVSEVFRVLKPGGKFIVSTPNRLASLTRNPWHVREYSADEFGCMLGCMFSEVKAEGIFGDGKVMDYYAKNRASVESVRRFDIFDLEHRLPRWLLQIPYDVLNRINRRRLLMNNRRLTSSITMEDYFVGPVADDCFDLFFTATK